MASIEFIQKRIEGKEKRKAEPSKEGTLGVEGIDLKILYELLSPYADGSAEEKERDNTL